MKRTGWILVFTFAAGTAAGLIADRLLNAQPEAVKRTVLLKTDLEGIQGKDATAFVIELAFLKGREKLKPHAVFSILQYDAE